MEHVHSDGPCRVCGLVPLAPSLTRSARVVAESARMQALLKRVARFARSDAPVVVLGETGTGKEVVARVLHANSPRHAKPFVAVNVAALPAELLESELFGHGKGAFTGAAHARRGLFEEAHEGTLFLDEIGEMPLPLQAKLLRALQDGEVRRVGESIPFAVNVRIVCATHRDLAERVRRGLFREDLYYRLKVLSVEVPPLRERRDDVLPLARHFLRMESQSLRGLTPAAEARLLDHEWPGNVRELQNVIKHGAALAEGSLIDVDDLPDELVERSHHDDDCADGTMRADDSAPTDRRSGSSIIPGRLSSLAEMERRHILAVLDACGGSQAEAARVLGIGRNTLWRKLRTYADEVRHD